MQRSVMFAGSRPVLSPGVSKPKGLDRGACTAASGENPRSAGKHPVLSGEVERLSVFLTLDASLFSLPHRSTLFHAFKLSLDITPLSIRMAEAQASGCGQKVYP